MSRLAALAAPLAPALLLALFAGWSGSFHGAAEWPAGPTGQALLLVGALFGVGALADPLRLGPAGRWLLWAAVTAVAASATRLPGAAGRESRTGAAAGAAAPSGCARSFAFAGAVATRSRAGRMGPGGGRRRRFGRCWRARSRLGRAPRCRSVTTICWLPSSPSRCHRRGGPGAPRAAALDLGGRPRSRGWVALAATRSWLGALAAVATAMAVARAVPRARRLAAGVALMGLGLLVPRLESMFLGADASAAARSVYARAGWSAAGRASRARLGTGLDAVDARRADVAPAWSQSGGRGGRLRCTPRPSSSATKSAFPAALLVGATGLLFAWRRHREMRVDARRSRTRSWPNVVFSVWRPAR